MGVKAMNDRAPHLTFRCLPSAGGAAKPDPNEREAEVLRELTGKEMGERPRISPHTVKRHIKRMLLKNGCRNCIGLG